MGQALVSWMMAAGSQFDEDGPGARDRWHRDALREARADGIDRRGAISFGDLVGVAGMGAFAGIAWRVTAGRPSPIAGPLPDCCALA